MAGVSIGTGLASGIDYTTMISQLMQIEAQPQTLLKTQLSNAQTDAAAYRRINTAFAALVTSASALTGTNFTNARTATSSSSAVTATAGPTAAIGSSVTFSVKNLAATHSIISSGSWTSATGDVRTAVPTGQTAPVWPIEVFDSKGVSVGKVDVQAGGSLNDAAAAINAAGFGLTATVVQLSSGEFRLQVASQKSGADGAFTLKTAAADATIAGSAFTVGTQGVDANLTLGALQATSATNTFSELMTGVSVTVSKADPTASTTISVDSDTAAITAKVQSLVSAANNVLSVISDNTDSRSGSKAALKGNYSLTSLASAVLTAVSSAVGDDGSAASAGLQLSRDGRLTFDTSVFQAKLASNPALVQRLFSGATGAGTDNVRGTADDSLDTDGIGARLQRLAQQANDSVSGTLTTLATGQDTRAKDLQTQIADWDLRLASRKTTLTAQFNAMETALGAIQNQASWLTSQINSLPSWSSNSKN
jgi:flagellar hook-associated protein 2